MELIIAMTLGLVIGGTFAYLLSRKDQTYIRSLEISNQQLLDRLMSKYGLPEFKAFQPEPESETAREPVVYYRDLTGLVEVESPVPEELRE